MFLSLTRIALKKMMDNFDVDEMLKTYPLRSFWKNCIDANHLCLNSVGIRNSMDNNMDYLIHVHGLFGSSLVYKTQNDILRLYFTTQGKFATNIS